MQALFICAKGGDSRVKAKSRKNKKHVSHRRTVLKILLVVAVIIACISGFRIYKFYWEMKHLDDTADSVRKTAGDSISDAGIWHPDYAAIKGLNPDYIGWIQWDTGGAQAGSFQTDTAIVSEPVLKGETNDTYLRHDIYHNYSSHGAVFMDCHDSLDDDNFVLYGHSLTGYKNDTHRFSRLQNMTDQGFFNEHRTFKMLYEDHAEAYEAVSAFVINTYRDHFHYTQNTFADASAKQAWIDSAMSHSEVTTGTVPDANDKFITLQTCADFGGSRYIIIGKRVSMILYQ